MYELENELTAEACNIQFGQDSCSREVFWIKFTDTQFNYKWDIEDARCREIVREKIGIETMRKLGSTGFHSWNYETMSRGKGTTIPEAEINCIIEICKVINNARKRK